MIQFRNEFITVFQSALFQTNCSVIEADEYVMIVDPNWLPHEIEEIRQHVDRIRGEKELYLLFTHGDFDHIIGYQAFPGAKVIGSKGLHEHPNKEKKLNLIHQFDNDYYIARPYPIAFPEVDIIVEEDEQKLEIGGMSITFYLAPGHTQDGLFTVIEPLGVWIAGDYLSDFELPFIYDSAKAYEQTLQKADRILRTHEISVLVPGHGKTTTNREEIRRRIYVAEEFLEQLIGAVIHNDTGKINELEKTMPFRSNFTKECHAENVTIIQREYLG